MNELSEEDFRTIIARRDGRYDGRFYFGVKTTRIYCRPICAARPKPENIIIFRSLTEAERNGYRPCLRCRPDWAPGNKRLDGTLNSVARALRIISDRADQELTLSELAASVGVSNRHLSRLFDQHLGASPIEIMITQRLHFAKQILLETTTPIAAIAMASGFKSIRRFNEAFKAALQQSPSEFRLDKTSPGGSTITLRIPVRLPYDWEGVLAYLKRHETYGVERILNESYQRYVPGAGGFGSFLVSFNPKQAFLKVEFFNIALQEIRPVLGRIKALFDTDHNPKDLPGFSDQALLGMRVPTGFDPFETAVSIIMGQVVSTSNAKGLMKRLVERFGRPIGATADGPIYAFPPPEALLNAPIEAVGTTRNKAGAIRGLAAALIDGTLDFRAHDDFARSRAKLLAIRGIGPWTVEMISMRCLLDPDAFPANDLIVKRALDATIVDPNKWGSSKAYLVHYLWRNFGESLSKAKGSQYENGKNRKIHD